MRSTAPSSSPDRREGLAHVVEHDHSVAQQAPSLLGVTSDSAGGIAAPVVIRGHGGWCEHMAHLWSGL
jgi:hypothetical protein